MLLSLQRNLNLLDWQSVNSQSSEVQAALTKPFSSNYNLELVAPVGESDFT